MDARRLLAAGALAAALAVLPAGCLLDSEKAPVIHGRGGTINITVSEGTMPEYSWDGGGMVALSVLRLGDQPQIVWEVRVPCVVYFDAGRPAAGRTDGQKVVSPVHHGYVPNGTHEIVRVEPRLTPGVRYCVSIGQDCHTSSSGGWAEFTPQ